MKVLRIILISLVILGITAGSYLYVSYLLDAEMEALLKQRVEFWDNQINANVKVTVDWYRNRGDRSFIKISEPRGERILSRMLETGSPKQRMWCSLFAIENSMTEKGFNTLMDVLRKNQNDRAGALAFYFLAEYAELDFKTAPGKFPNPTEAQLENTIKATKNMLKKYPFGKPYEQEEFEYPY